MKKEGRPMKYKIEIDRLPTGIKNLDTLLCGGLPKGSVTVVCGTPGAGKTTFAQQICFNNATSKEKAIIFQTLSEPAAKTIKYMSQFGFFDQTKLNKSVEFVDLGGILRSQGLATATSAMMEQVKRVKPSLVIIDSFKVFDDLAESKEQLRKFTYEIAVQLMAWEITAFLLGEYSPKDIECTPLFSVVDGIITMRNEEQDGIVRRVLRVMKMRGTDHERNPQEFEVTHDGIIVRAARKKK
jgi:circadian clock protein KaiC